MRVYANTFSFATLLGGKVEIAAALVGAVLQPEMNPDRHFGDSPRHSSRISSSASFSTGGRFCEEAARTGGKQ